VSQLIKLKAVIKGCYYKGCYYKGCGVNYKQVIKVEVELKRIKVR
jgi:hypothetical protein